MFPGAMINFAQDTRLLVKNLMISTQSRKGNL
jgi:hypothetical protein